MRRFSLLMCQLVLAATLLAPGFAAAADAKLSVVVSSTSFAWFPLYVADGAGFFKEEKVDIEITNVKDGAAVVTAIQSGDADIAGVGANAIFAARYKKQPVVLLTPMSTEYTSVIFGRKEVFGKKGITATSTIEQKVEALKGLKIGVIYFNGAQHTMFRFLMSRYGKAELDKVSEVVPIGDAGATLAGMSRGLVDVTAFSPPVPQRAMADGYGAILLDPIHGDIPATRGMVFTAMAVTEALAKSKEKDLQAFVRAIDKANTLIRTDTAKAGQAARKHMSSMQSDLYDAGVKAMVAATPKSAEVPIEGLKTYYELLKFGGEKYAQDAYDFDASAVNHLVRNALKK